MNEKDRYPKISVIMGIYNCANTLPEAIDSVIAQTWKNWELIMCDDGSSDSTWSVAEEYRQKFPERIKLIKHSFNCGLNKTLNDCLSMADGQFIARMDGDDISDPKRFEKEMLVFQQEPNLSIVSCVMDYFDEEGTWGICTFDEYPHKETLVNDVIHGHAAAIIRADALHAVGGYSVSKHLIRVEDWDLWIKLYAKGFQGKNIQECLYHVRDTRNSRQKKRKFSYAINGFRVSLFAIRALNLQTHYYLYSLRPLLVGLLPYSIYSLLHRWNQSRNLR